MITTSALSQPEWRMRLESAGAILADDRVVHFGNPDAECRAAENGDILADLSHLAVVHASGAEVQTFLQGQLSNDIRLVSESHAQLSAYCNAKGRMIAVFLVSSNVPGSYLLQLPAAVAEATLKRLRMFVMRAKVTLEMADSRFGHLGLSGPNAASLLKSAMGTAPENDYECVTIDEVHLIRLPGPHARFDIHAPLDRLKSLWDLFASSTTPVGAGPWSWLDIMAGIPVILPGTVEEFVPQMANLDLVGGVSFTKGCYPGQEIVARMHYLGRLKQRMFRAQVDSAIAPLPGTPVFAPDMPGQSTGTIINAQASPHGGSDLLVVAHLSSIVAGELHLAASDGPRLTLLNLPYSLQPLVGA